MLPLLPALLLLLLQGPSNIDRSTVDCRLAALDAIHRQLAQPSGALTEGDEEALASLLASGIQAYLLQTETKVAPRIEAQREAQKPILPQRGILRLQDGYTQCRRSRDGPSTIASLA